MSTIIGRTSRAAAVVLFLAVAALTIVTVQSSNATSRAAGVQSVVLLSGTAVGEQRDLSSVSNLPGADQALCFDLDLVDAATGRVIGTATDCLIDIQNVGDGLSLSAVTFFNFPGGTIISEGQTTVQPVTIGSSSATHITGAIPDANANTFIGGTGRFQGATGQARLSGAVDLSELASLGQATFNCIFVLSFD